jgi:hypothetical protein
VPGSADVEESLHRQYGINRNMTDHALLPRLLQMSSKVRTFESPRVLTLPDMGIAPERGAAHGVADIAAQLWRPSLTVLAPSLMDEGGRLAHYGPQTMKRAGPQLDVGFVGRLGRREMTRGAPTRWMASRRRD